MPAASKKQWKFMKSISEGWKPEGKEAGLSKEEAAEFIKSQPTEPKDLPKKVKKS